MGRDVGILVGLVVGIAVVLVGIAVVVACSFFCFRKWRKKKFPITITAFYRTRSYEEEVPPTPSSIQSESVYSFATPSIVTEGINPSDTIEFSYDKAESPYIELPADPNAEIKEKTEKFRFLDPKRSKSWKSGWIDRVTHMIEATETYSRAAIRRFSDFVSDPGENCDSEGLNDRNEQSEGMSEGLVDNLSTGKDIYARVKK
ncbi:uncharacterized protein LOC133187264 [Saccostrea echinata]|uniref:uncharacterized protein LOC133187264 n=1 Tax=Saccostrea echinata TaxID=191078 RepID=UPI002A82A47F|nr:uncharacterized protein LOC133187264 [Saccostrea echinata]